MPCADTLLSTLYILIHLILMTMLWGYYQLAKEYTVYRPPQVQKNNEGDIRDVGSVPGSRRSPGGGHGNPLQYSCLENSMDRGAWQATVHSVAQSWTRLKQLSMHA